MSDLYEVKTRVPGECASQIRVVNQKFPRKNDMVSVPNANPGTTGKEHPFREERSYKRKEREADV